jgi:signal transduction histidine kinase
MTGDAGPPAERPFEVVSREDVLGVSSGSAILIVDDSATNLVAYEAALAPLGRQLILASSGDEALAKLLEQDYALILLDVSMPGMNGLETARLIRGRPRTSTTPLIFISGQAWTDDVVVDAYRLGALDFVTKPILPEVLRAKARLYLQLQERTLELLRRTSDLHEADQLHAEDTAENDRKDELIALLGHELRNPLAVMTSALDVMALREGSLGRELVIVQRQIRHLARMVDDLVDVSRIRHGTIEIRPTRVPVALAVADAIENVRPLLDSKSHTVEVEVATDLSVEADPARLVQALTKAFDNAARYTPTGGRICVSATRDTSFIRLCVEDNGQGISRELLPRIFDAFVQEPRALDRSAGGLGLGLTLVRTLVELHGGRVTADSPGDGLGTTLAIYWPQARAVP